MTPRGDLEIRDDIKMDLRVMICRVRTGFGHFRVGSGNGIL